MFIKIKVFPNEKKDSIVKKSEDAYIIKVREKAEEGKANQRVKEILAEYFKIVPGKIKLVKGGRRPNKIFELLP